MLHGLLLRSLKSETSYAWILSNAVTIRIILQVHNSHLMASPKTALNPRKTPSQARSAFTVEMIFDATIQVLLDVGIGRLTTTRVADRAGVSVGTLYQYFPNKDSLLAAVLQRHLSAVAASVDAAGAHAKGRSVSEIVNAIAGAFFTSKFASPKRRVRFTRLRVDSVEMKWCRAFRRGHSSLYAICLLLHATIVFLNFRS
jgi:AcrR family transcriptional regulator